jgi:D-galactose 1-dehydrogenase
MASLPSAPPTPLAQKATIGLSAPQEIEGRPLKSYDIGIIGIGKITQDQHLPAIAKNSRFRLAGLVSQRGLQQPGVPTFRTPAELYAALPNLDAVAICTPPSVRYGFAREALDAGKHVLLEKPPAPTMAEMNDLTAHAAALGKVIFATWHLQYNAAVDEARKRLLGRTIRSLAIEWKEDVRHWHPNQDWIWEAGNFGIFDPGVNALSLLTKIMPGPSFVRSAELVFPANRDTPIAASLVLTSPALENASSTMTAEFDWRKQDGDVFDFDIATADGTALRVTHGGSKLFVDGRLIIEEPIAEYEGIYRHFVELLDEARSAMDAAPFQLVADAFLIGRRTTTAAFNW